MMEMPLDVVCEMCEGTLVKACPGVVVKGVVTDSRNIPGEHMFIAICGEKFDGHDFINSAVSNGAVCVLSQKKDIECDVPVIYVEDTIKALSHLAKNYKKTFSNLKTVAVTGSVGKTTTKEMIYNVFCESFVTYKTSGNLNNHLGVPLTLLSIDKDAQAAVVEMGMNHAGEISILTDIIRPDVCVITNIGVAHIGYLGSREEILKAKLEILEGLNPNGLIVFNGDDSFLFNVKTSKRPIYYGIDNKFCDVTARNITNSNSQTMFDIMFNGRGYPCVVNTIGRHNIMNALCAFSVGVSMGMNADDVVRGLLNFRSPSTRQHIFNHNGVNIIDDTCNANPDSVKAAIAVLDSIAQKGKKRVAVLGGMGELGEYEEEGHEICGRFCAGHVDFLIVYDQGGEYYSRGAVENGFDKNNIFMAKDHEQAIEKLRRVVSDGDTVLFKGSKYLMRMEKALELYMK